MIAKNILMQLLRAKLKYCAMNSGTWGSLARQVPKKMHNDFILVNTYYCLHQVEEIKGRSIFI